jgi:hypothetical protein
VLLGYTRLNIFGTVPNIFAGCVTRTTASLAGCRLDAMLTGEPSRGASRRPLRGTVAPTPRAGMFPLARGSDRNWRAGKRLVLAMQLAGRTGGSAPAKEG